MRHLRHLMRAAKHLARNPHLPQWVKWLVAAGLLPIPGPVDEILLVIALAILLLRHRPAVRQAWNDTRQ